MFNPWRIALALSAILLASNAFGSVTPVTLGDITVETQGSLTAVTLRLSEKPAWGQIAPKLHGNFLQFDLPNTMVTNPGQFQEGDGKFIAKVVAFQATEKDAAFRIFLLPAAPKDMNVWRAEVLEKQLIISVAHSGADAIIATTRVESTSSKAPSELLQTQDGKPEAFATFDKKLQRNLKISTWFAIAGIFMIGFLYWLRPRMRLRKQSGRQSDEPLIRVLATENLGHKQQIRLIEAAGEKILLSITPTGIQFLTTLSQPAAQPMLPPSFMHAMATAPQRALPEQTSEFESSQSYSPPKRTNLEMRAPAKAEAPQRKSSTNKTPINDKASTQSVNDVTKMIRERLKNLPQIA
jgi:flagellar biogenesis protein FliO